MLNRRILRVKAMQALYGYFVIKDSMVGVVRDELAMLFTPDPAKHDLSDTSEWDEKRKYALQTFADARAGKPVDLKTGVGVEVEQALNRYEERLHQEANTGRQRMLDDVSAITRTYYKLLWMLVEFRHLDKLDREKQQHARIKKEEDWTYQLLENPFIETISLKDVLQKASSEGDVSWSNEMATLRSWYKDVLRKDEEFQAYQQMDPIDTEGHRKALEQVYKRLVFKHEALTDYWFGQDSGWTENAPVLKSLLIKTIQQLPSEPTEPWELKKVMLNEEEDLSFFRTIYSETIKRSDELDELVARRTKNWELNRVALTDRVILKMALAEMMSFPSIPVKVSINEYIEMSKTYSTPKSKQFVNGILDVLANELTSEGVIRKSGRGLIDNK